MAYQKKYYFQFTDITNRVHVVELWQNTEDVLVAEEINSVPAPFVVEMPEISHKFQVVRGTGCQINLLSATDMKFYAGLYHVNPTDFKVLHYIDTVLNWCGYLNAEMMTEPYDINFNYQVSITGNDGFSLMDRFSFIQVDETNYTGIKSKFELLQIIFAKIGLPFVEYRIALATTFTGYSSGVDKTILHESYMDCANFYDEDNKPMSLREVVESILAPYGANIRAEGGNIYITDIHSLASLSSVTYKQFTISSGAYAGAIAIPNVKAIGTVGYLGTGQNIERSGGVNRQVVSYSPYPVSRLYDEALTGYDEFGTIPGTWSTKDGYYYKTLGNNTQIEFDSIYEFAVDPPTFEASYYDDFSDENVYLRRKIYTVANQRIAYFKTNPFFVVTAPQSLEDLKKMVMIQISGKMFVRTKLNPYDESEESPYTASTIFTYWRVKVGDKYPIEVSPFTGWSTTPSDVKVSITNAPNNVLDDWHEFRRGVYIDANLSGDLHIELWSTVEAFGQIGGTNPTQIREIWIKELKIELKRTDQSDIPDSDKEYIGLLDKSFQNEGEKITLMAGTDTLFADRGKIMKFDGTDYSSIISWTRNGQTYNIEELLLNSVSSNYRAGFVTLTNMRLKNSVLLQNIFTDTFIGSAKMMVKSAAINHYDNVFECSLTEILPDELTIVKS